MTTAVESSRRKLNELARQRSNGKAADASDLPPIPPNIPSKFCGDFVLIRMSLTQETEGGIVIPDRAKMGAHEQFKEGLVVAKGPGRYTSSGELVPVYANVGEKVLFDRRGADKLKEDSECVWFVMKEQYVTGIFG